MDFLYRKKSLYVIAMILIAEGAAIIAVPSRMPRAARAITGAVNVLAALGLLMLARQKR